ncbi:MAG: hypothetical protein IJO87_08300 [Eggerthellaceae bacterium]|nr:hypothetical protein [Eggerthellaceae bacterium]
MRILFDHLGLSLGDYDINKTVVMLAYAEGADVLQASAVAASESLMLAVKMAEDLRNVDPLELRRKLLGEIDSDDAIASGLMRAEDIINAVPTAYRVSSLKVVIGADGWARFELPVEGA